MRWFDVTDTTENVLRLCFRRTRMFDLATIRRLVSGNKGPEFDLQTGLTALRFCSSIPQQACTDSGANKLHSKMKVLLGLMN
jgi:hypothetical protein